MNLLAVISLLAAFMILGGTMAARAGLLTRDYRPDNVFSCPAELLLGLQRVAVLPLAAESKDADLPAGCEMLGPVLHDALVRTKRFEVVSVSPDDLHHCTGRAAWTGAENLPPDFFEALRRVYGCDAVMFCELTVFHAYAPLAVGWRLKLVDARTRQILWSADEIFDASQPSVLKGAKHFQRRESPAVDEWAMLNSPRQFGRYSAATLLAGMPEK
jgi:hypothetical protein